MASEGGGVTAVTRPPTGDNIVRLAISTTIKEGILPELYYFDQVFYSYAHSYHTVKDSSGNRSRVVR